jgi:ribokinase
MPTFDVITIGSALLDIYLKSDDFAKLSAKQFPDGKALALEYGGKTEVDSIEVCSGGAATNNAVSFAKKGFKTAVIAEIGTDLIGTTVKEELKRERVDVGMLVEEESEETGISCIMVHPQGGRSVAVFRGASKLLTVEDIPWHKLDTKWLFISSLGGDIKLLKELITYAKANHIQLAVNPGKAELEQAKTTGRAKLYQEVDILILNREEAALLTDEPYHQDHFWQLPQTIPGPHIVFITDGKHGGKVSVDGHTRWYKPKIVPALEETGAGDAFGSAVVAAIIKGHSLDRAIKWGTAQAASVVSFMGAKRGLLSRTAIEKIR